jgi:glycosyltransferase involved in cell wall biosynthesis
MKEPLISVVVPSYNSSPTISACLDSLFSQKGDTSFEVVVADSSRDSTRSEIESKWPQVELVKLPEKTFAGPSRNAGARAARGRYLAFIDADCTADPFWIQTIRDRFREGWVAIGGSIENGSKNCYWSRAEYLLELLEFSPRSPARGALFLSSANSAYLKELFMECGGFPDIRLGEDMLLAEKIRRKGVDTRFFPEIRISHMNHTGMDKFYRKQLSHGIYSVRARREANLPGGFLIRHPYLLPALPFFRLLRVLLRVRKLDRSLFRELFLTFPAFGSGTLAWSAGFLKGVLEKKKER